MPTRKFSSKTFPNQSKPPASGAVPKLGAGCLFGCSGRKCCPPGPRRSIRLFPAPLQRRWETRPGSLCSPGSLRSPVLTAFGSTCCFNAQQRHQQSAPRPLERPISVVRDRKREKVTRRVLSNKRACFSLSST